MESIEGADGSEPLGMLPGVKQLSRSGEEFDPTRAGHGSGDEAVITRGMPGSAELTQPPPCVVVMSGMGSRI